MRTQGGAAVQPHYDSPGEAVVQSPRGQAGDRVRDRNGGASRAGRRPGHDVVHPGLARYLGQYARVVGGAGRRGGLRCRVVRCARMAVRPG